MAAIDFPNSPSTGQVFSAGGKSWTYNGSTWVLNVATASKTAYDIAVDNGFVGTEAQWLASLVGDDGAPYGNIDGGKANTNYGSTLTLVQGGNAGSF